jgi:hypothetical protein
MNEKIKTETWGDDRESWKKLWSARCHAKQLNDPDHRDMYLDYVEVMTEQCCSPGPIEILGRDFFTFWRIQKTFLLYSVK